VNSGTLKHPGIARATFLLVRLQLRRLLNTIVSGELLKLRRGTSEGARQVAQKKNGASWPWPLLLCVFMVFSFGNLSYHAIVNLEYALQSQVDVSALAEYVIVDGQPQLAAPITADTQTELSPDVLRSINLIFLLIFIELLGFSLASRELARPQ